MAGPGGHPGRRPAAARAPARHPNRPGALPAPAHWRHDRQPVPPHPRRRDRGHPGWQREDHPQAPRCRRPRPRRPGPPHPAHLRSREEDRVMTLAASPPRPLPIRPRPVTGESPASYLRRLARANHLRPGYLRRYLRQPGSEGTIRLDWLATLAGRPLPALERALASPAGGPGGHPGPPGRRTRQADKPRLFAAIRRDARDNGLSIRALADRHGVHRRTVRQALTSPWPAPRRSYERRSKLDPFKDAIDAMLLPEAHGSGNPPRTAKEIFDRLVAEHTMTGVSYATVRDYVASRRPIQSSGPSHADSDIRDAQLMITHLKGLF